MGSWVIGSHHYWKKEPLEHTLVLISSSDVMMVMKRMVMMALRMDWSLC